MNIKLFRCDQEHFFGSSILVVFPVGRPMFAGPAYAFELDDQWQVLCDDAITLDETWEELADTDWTPTRLKDADMTPERRASALQRIRACT